MPLEDLTWRWKRDSESGWWRLHCEDGWSQSRIGSLAWSRVDRRSGKSERIFEGDENWSGLQFRLTDRKQEELQDFYPPADKPPLQYANISAGLQNVLHEISSFQIITNYGFCFDKLIPNVLEMVENPATVLERLEVNPVTWKGRMLDLGILVDAVKAGKLMGLKSLSLRCPHGSLMYEPVFVALARVMELGQLPNLENLSVTSVEADNDAFKAFAKAITSGNLVTLTKLELRECGIDDNKAKELALVFESGKLKTLAVLDLRGNQIGNEGMIALATSLEVGGFSYLNHLDVTGNNFSGESFPSIADAIASGNLSSLMEVHLSNSLRRSDERMVEVLLSALLSPRSPKVTHVQCCWHEFSRLQRQYEQLVLKNEEHRRIMAELGESVAPATVGKVYLCGDPEVGKTTLRKSLERSFLKSLFGRERRSRTVERTRGIDVSVLGNKSSQHQPDSISLMLWDIAGQNEYHLIHNSFFADLGTEEGESITFLVMCKSGDNIETAKEQLEYWLKFISSSVKKGLDIYREVCVVVNRTDGDSQVVKDISQWQEMVDSQVEKFDGVLKLCSPLFAADVRKRKAVGALKQHLIERAASKLENIKVPALCHFVQTHLYEWSQEKKHFPVVGWDEFLRLVKEKGVKEKGGLAAINCQEKTLEAAVKYFNQSGVLVYINKEFPREWNIPYQRLVILNPSWFCGQVVGNMFVPSNMRRPGEDIFRDKVDPHTGSIPISVFNDWLEKVVGGWDTVNFDYLMIILLWLGLCYLGREKNLFIPSLASEGSLHSVSHGQLEDSWDVEHSKRPAYEEGEPCQWVMGYSVHRAKEEKTLTPIALWHKFQVELAQTSTFNGHLGDNCFVTTRYFVSFRLDSMGILIKVHADLERPTFDGINIFVKPLFRRELDVLDVNVRKQRQVDLANNLTEMLITKWIEVCPTIKYIVRIVWPCQTFAFQPNRSCTTAENVEVTQVKNWVQEHGVGRVMNWTVGDYREPVTEDQLLSTSDKKLVVQSLKRTIFEGRDLMREAMILYDEVSDEGSTQHRASTLASQKEEMTFPESATEVERYFYIMFCNMNMKLDIVIEQCETVNKQLNNLMREKRNLVQKVGDVGRMFLEDKERSCPRFIHLGTKSGSWISLKAALSPSVTTHVHFACEAKYNSYGQHVVEGQDGIEVVELKPWAQKLLPWFRVSLTVLYVSAKLTANVLAPGMGLILPNCPQWLEASSLAEGLQSATGYSKNELDEFMRGQVDFGATTTLEGMKQLYGNSRMAMTEMLGKLTIQEYEKKLGMRKVQLYYSDRSSHGVVWICNDCFMKFKTEGLVSEL